MKRILAILLLLILLTTVVIAQGNINYGDTVTGELTAGVRDEYTFSATAGDLVSISLTADEFDTYLYLLGPNDTEIQFDDDGGVGFNSLISGFTIPETATYTIQAASFDDGGGGAYELTLRLQEAVALSYGDMFESEENVGIFSFEGRTGDVIVASMTAASGQETTLNAIHPEGYNFAFGAYIDNQNTRIGPIELTADGEYLLTANAESSFTLSLTRPEIVPITVGEPSVGKFTESSDTAYFSLLSEGGRVLDFNLDSGETLDTELALFSPFGFEIATSDPRRETGSDPSMEQVVVDEIGTYYVIVSNDEAVAGEFTLSVTESELPSLDDGPQVAKFNFDTNNHIFTFDGTAGQAVDIRVNVDSQQEFSAPTIQLLQNEQEIAFVSSSGLNTFQFEVMLPDDGQVTLVAQAFSDVSLTIEVIKDAE